MIASSYNLDVPEALNTARFFKEIYTDHLYALETVVDAGANRGLFTYYIAPFAKHVYSIEPHTPSVALIAKNIATPGLEHVQVFHCALGGQEGNRELDLNRDDGGYALLHKPGDIKTYTLRSFMTMAGITHIDLLKIDIEASEGEVFNAPDIDEALKHISLITGEGHGMEGWHQVLERNHFVFTKRQDGFFARKES